ncbi:I78 family peptidase inhibitor [Advenella kashmirensis]
MKQLIVAIPLVMLAACQTPAPGQAQTEDQCGANSRQSLVGTQETALNKSTLPKATRIIHPDSAVTMDYSAQRLNIHVGKDGKISRVTCG